MVWNPWSDKDILHLRMNYQIIENQLLSQIYNRTTKQISFKARNLGLGKNLPRYTLNEKYFDIWSPNMSYILGFTMSDGSVGTYDGRSKLSYYLAIKDKCILDFISKELFGQNFVYIGLNRRKEKFHKQCRLSIFSNYLVKKLENYNIIQNKTGREILPSIPENLKADYLRGLFDGDGCISRSNNRQKNLRFSVCSASKNFLEEVRINLGFGFGKINKNNSCFDWRVNKIDEIRKLYNFIYYDGFSFGLQRKKDKFLCGKL